MSIEGFEAEGMALLPQAFQNRAELFARMDHQEATLQQDQTQFDYAQQKLADQWQQNYNLKSAEWEAQKIRNTRQAFIDEQTLNDKNLSIQQKQAALEQADMTAATMPAQATAQLAPLMDFDTEYARQASTFKPEYAVASQFMLLSEFDLKQKAKNAKTDEEREMVAWWMRESAITSKIFNQISGAAVGEHEEAQERLEHLRRDLEQDAKVEVLTGEDVAQTITSYAARTGAAFIAMSTHGRTGFRHFVLGSVTEGVVRSSTTPVICFPQKT